MASVFIERDLNGEYFVFEIEPNGYKYDFGVNRCDNPIKLIWWIHHLCEKNWVTPELVASFISIATEKMGIKLYEGEG